MKIRKKEGCKPQTLRSRVVPAVMAGILALSAFSMTAFAEESSTSIGRGETKQSAQTSLSYKVYPDYTVVIPSKVDLKSQLIITATKINTEPGYQVQVRASEGLSENGEVTLKRTNDDQYAILVPLKMNNQNVQKNTALAAFADKSTDAIENTGTLTFGKPYNKDDGEDIKAGDYTGTVTFTVSYTSVKTTENK